MHYEEARVRSQKPNPSLPAGETSRKSQGSVSFACGWTFIFLIFMYLWHQRKTSGKGQHNIVYESLQLDPTDARLIHTTILSRGEDLSSHVGLYGLVAEFESIDQ